MKKFLTLILLMLIVLQPLTVSAQIESTLSGGAEKIKSLIGKLKGADALPTVPTTDTKLNAKENGICWKIFCLPSMDEMANIIVKTTIEQMVHTTVDWINGDARNGPRFVTNPGRFFEDVAYNASNEFIEGEELGFLCSPFQDQIRTSLGINFAISSGRAPQDQFQCTIDEAWGNINSFFDGDFTGGGGWNTWFAVTQNDTNNPYGAYVSAKLEMDSRIQKAVDAEGKKLDWGKGFLSTERNGEIVTPGTLIEEQLNAHLGAGLARLELADEYDELISALLGRLLSKSVLSSNGLLGYQVGANQAGNVDDAELTCRASREDAAIGDEIRWTADTGGFVGTNSKVIYTWHGEGVEGRDGTTVSTTYQTQGLKRPSVEAVITDKDGEVVKTISRVQCDNSVTISQFKPLTVACYPTLIDRQTNAEIEGATNAQMPALVKWKAVISGGSGRITTISWAGGGPRPGDTIEDFPKNLPYEFEDTLTAYRTVFYSPATGRAEEGEYFGNVSVIDADPYVKPVLDNRCERTIYLY